MSRYVKWISCDKTSAWTSNTQLITLLTRDPGMHGSPVHRLQHCHWQQEEMKGLLKGDVDEMALQVHYLKVSQNQRSTEWKIQYVLLCAFCFSAARSQIEEFIQAEIGLQDHSVVSAHHLIEILTTIMVWKQNRIRFAIEKNKSLKCPAIDSRGRSTRESDIWHRRGFDPSTMALS